MFDLFSLKNGTGTEVGRIKCKDDGMICLLESYLASNFYIKTRSVFGKGEVKPTKGAGTVPLKEAVFKVTIIVLPPKQSPIQNNTVKELTDEEAIVNGGEMIQRSNNMILLGAFSS